MGYGNHVLPDTFSAKIFTSVYLLLGISLITLVGSTIYTYIQWKGNQSRLSRDRMRIAKRGLEMTKQSALERTDSQQRLLVTYIGNITKEGKWTDKLIYAWKRSKDFVRHNTIGHFFYESLILVALVTIGALAVGKIEGWSTIDSFYFAIVTMTTVG